MKKNRQCKRARKAKKEARQVGLIALAMSSIALASIGGTVWFLVKSEAGSKHVHIDLRVPLAELFLLCIAVWTVIVWAKTRARAKRAQERAR